MKSDKMKILVGYIFISLVWGSTWLAIRLGLDSLTPLISAGLRFFLASILIFFVIKIKTFPLHNDARSIGLYFFMGFCSFVIPFGLVYWAEQFIPSGLTSVLFGVFPFSVYLFSLLLLDNEQTDKYKLLSVIVGFIGILIIFYDGVNVDVENHLVGLIAVVVSAIMQGSVAVVIKKWGGHLNSFSMNGPPLLIAGISMIIFAFLFEDSSTWNFDQNAILSITYLAVFGTILAFSIYFWLLKRINAVLLSLSSFITPIIAVLLGWIFLNEQLSQQVLLGTLFVLMGILFGNFNALKKSLLQKKGTKNA